jgi:hypothetical protein
VKPVIGSGRRSVIRAGRRFSVCGLARAKKRVERLRYGLGWLTGATLLVAILYSAYAIERPPILSEGISRPALAGAERYTFDDFAGGMH